MKFKIKKGVLYAYEKIVDINKEIEIEDKIQLNDLNKEKLEFINKHYTIIKYIEDSELRSTPDTLFRVLLPSVFYSIKDGKKILKSKKLLRIKRLLWFLINLIMFCFCFKEMSIVSPFLTSFVISLVFEFYRLLDNKFQEISIKPISVKGDKIIENLEELPGDNIKIIGFIAKRSKPFFIRVVNNFIIVWNRFNSSFIYTIISLIAIILISFLPLILIKESVYYKTYIPTKGEYLLTSLFISLFLRSVIETFYYHYIKELFENEEMIGEYRIVIHRNPISKEYKGLKLKKDSIKTDKNKLNSKALTEIKVFSYKGFLYDETTLNKKIKKDL